MGRGLQPDQPSGWEGEVPGAACVPAVSDLQSQVVERRIAAGDRCFLILEVEGLDGQVPL